MFLLNFKEVHPLRVGVSLLVLSIINSLQLNIFNKSRIYSMIIYLIVIGGFLILFLYFNRFVLNVKVFYRFNKLILFFYIIFLFIFIWFYLFLKLDIFSYFIFIDRKILDINKFNIIWVRNQQDLNKIYFKMNNLVIFGIIYLFYVLVIIVKVIYYFRPKSLRKIIYERYV